MPRMTWDREAGQMIQNDVWDGPVFVAYDDEERYIAAAWPSSDWVQAAERFVGFAAERLADAVLDDPTGDHEWVLRDYRVARDEARHVRALWDRLHASRDVPWAFPGALVRA